MFAWDVDILPDVSSPPPHQNTETKIPQVRGKVGECKSRFHLRILEKGDKFEF